MNINDLINERKQALFSYENSDADTDIVEENMGDITGEVEESDTEVDDAAETTEEAGDATDVDDDAEEVEEGKCGGKKKSKEEGSSKKACKESIDDIEFEDVEDDENVEDVKESTDEFSLTDIFDEDDIKDIMLEEMDIEDPEEYMENAIKEFSEESLSILGEMYIDELVTEDAIMFCNSTEELESIEEAFKENVAGKANSAKESIKKIAKKFAAFIQNLINSIVNLFSSGETLVKKYKSTIESSYKANGGKIKVKTYKYSHNPAAITDLLNTIGASMKELGSNPHKYMDKGSTKTVYANSTGTDGSVEGIKQAAVDAIRSGAKQEYMVSDIPIADIIDLTSNKNKHIKTLKDLNRSFQKKCSQAITVLATARYVGPNDKNSKKQVKDAQFNAIGAVKMGSRLYNAAATAYVGELRAANRAYTAICRKLVSKSDSKAKEPKEPKEKKAKK